MHASRLAARKRWLRPRTDRWPGSVACPDTGPEAHSPPEPMAAHARVQTRCVARKRSSHHSPVLQSQFEMSWRACAAVLSERSPSVPCKVLQRASTGAKTIECAGARVPTNHSRASPTSSLEAGRCVSMLAMPLAASRCPSHRLRTGLALPQ